MLQIVLKKKRYGVIVYGKKLPYEKKAAYLTIWYSKY